MRFALISSARATNEENYLAQKFARAVMGTNNVDNCARLCHAPSAAGLAATFGLGGGTNPFEDLDRCDAILLVGAEPDGGAPGRRLPDLPAGHARAPVWWWWIPGAPHWPGTPTSTFGRGRERNVAVFNGLAHLLVREGLVDQDFLEHPRRAATRNCSGCSATIHRIAWLRSPASRRRTWCARR